MWNSLRYFLEVHGKTQRGYIITDTLLKKKASDATVSHTRIFISKEFSYIKYSSFFSFEQKSLHPIPSKRQKFPNFFRADNLHMQIVSTYGTYIHNFLFAVSVVHVSDDW
jgi:hypothetical protein